MTVAPDRVIVDTLAAAAAANVAPATIRSWAQRGRISRVGVDHRGRTTYDLGDVMRVAATPAHTV